MELGTKGILPRGIVSVLVLGSGERGFGPGFFVRGLMHWRGYLDIRRLLGAGKGKVQYSC